MLLESRHASYEGFYIPNNTHPDVQVFLDKIAKEQGRFNYQLPNLAETPRYSVWHLSAHLGGGSCYEEGYIACVYPGMIKMQSTAYTLNRDFIPWELVYKIKYANRRNGKEPLVDINPEEVRRHNLIGHQHEVEYG